MHPSFSHGTYSYYKEPSVGRISSEKTSNVFLMNGTKFAMNLKVSQIINSRYYRTVETASLPEGMSELAGFTGTVTDYQNSEHPYTIRLYSLGKEVYTYAESDQIEFFAISGALEALQLAEVMTFMARCVSVDQEMVIEAYSSRQNIDYSRKRLELFQNIAPENGAIEELFEDHGNFAGRTDHSEMYGDNYDREQTAAEEGGTDESDKEQQGDTYETDNLDDGREELTGAGDTIG
jgi:hypothetical protein